MGEMLAESLPILKSETPVARYVQAHSPTRFEWKRGGRLRDSYKAKITSPKLSVVGTFYTRVPYFKFVVGGVKPHLIEGNPLLAFPFLRFHVRTKRWMGLAVFPRVMHPGQKANPYNERAIKRYEKRFLQKARQVLLASIEALKV